MNLKQTTLTLICCISMQLLASAQFANPVKIIDGGSSRFPTNLIVDDFNYDGSIDVISIDFPMFLLDNVNNGQMELNTEIYFDERYALKIGYNYNFKSGDLNGDNVPDLYSLGDYFVWLKNDGTGNFTFGDSINIFSDNDKSIVVDINNDGWNEIVVNLEGANNLNVLNIDSSGEFSMHSSIITDTSYSDFNDFVFYDYNSDNLPDLFLSFYDRIEIYLNNSNNTFRFLERIDYNQSGFKLKVLDFDNDSVVDIIGYGNDKVVLFKNQEVNWSAETILGLDETNDIYKLEIADLDNNAKYELIALKYTNQTKELSVYANWESQFSDTILVFDTTSILDFEIVEIDNNGSLDMVFLKINEFVSYEQFSNIGWLASEDLLNEDIESDTSNFQLNLDDVIEINRSVSFQNIDSDIQTELIYTQTNNNLINQLVVVNGTNLNENFTKNILFESTLSASDTVIKPQAIIGDIDGDNFKDIILKVGKFKFAAFIHDGVNGYADNPDIFPIDSTTLFDFRLYGLHDKEGDGDLDLYTSFKFNDGWKLVWLLNNGNGVFDDFTYIDSSPFELDNGFIDVQLGDFNGDLLEDLIANSNETIVWYKNVGNGDFGNKNVLSDIEYGNYNKVEIVDLNNDGTKEVFVYGTQIYCIGHFNCFYSPVFYVFDFINSNNTLDLINVNSSYPYDVSFADFDLVYNDLNNDGSLDILSINHYESKLIVLLGDGFGNFSSVFEVMTSGVFKYNESIGLYLTDIDGDGDNDIVFLAWSYFESAIYLIENKEIDLGVDGDEDGIVLLYDCNDADSTILDTLITPVIAVTDNFCEGSELIFNIENVANNVTYQWMTPNGNFDIANFEIEELSSSDEGLYQVQSFSNHCESPINEILIEVYDNPNVEVSFMNDSIIAISEEQNLSYQWFLNGNEIEGANDDYYVPTETGEYQVSVVNENGCEDISDVYQHIINGLLSNQMETFKIYPNPVSNNTFLNITIPNKWLSEEIAYVILNANGQEMFKGVLSNSNQIPIQKLSAGYYSLNLITQTNLGQASFFVVD